MDKNVRKRKKTYENRQKCMKTGEYVKRNRRKRMKAEKKTYENG